MERKTLRLLVICHANTSRSVMAEAMLCAELATRGLSDRVSVSSGGIAPYARDGALVSLDARLMLRQDGIELPADSVATDLKRNRHLIEEADLLLAMTGEQIAMLRRDFPEATEKSVCTFKEFAGGEGDIEDPANRDENAYSVCQSEIKACVEPIVDRLAADVRR